MAWIHSTMIFMAAPTKGGFASRRYPIKSALNAKRYLVSTRKPFPARCNLFFGKGRTYVLADCSFSFLVQRPPSDHIPLGRRCALSRLSWSPSAIAPAALVGPLDAGPAKAAREGLASSRMISGEARHVQQPRQMVFVAKATGLRSVLAPRQDAGKEAKSCRSKRRPVICPSP
jgi:hypothetical protein